MRACVCACTFVRMSDIRIIIVTFTCTRTHENWLSHHNSVYDLTCICTSTPTPSLAVSRRWYPPHASSTTGPQLLSSTDQRSMGTHGEGGGGGGGGACFSAIGRLNGLYTVPSGGHDGGRDECCALLWINAQNLSHRGTGEIPSQLLESSTIQHLIR